MSDSNADARVAAPNKRPRTRLRAERPCRDHSPLYARLFEDERVAEMLWPGRLGGPRTSAQSASLVAADTQHWHRERCGPWVFFEADTGAFVGRGGLQRSDLAGDSRIEVLYAVHPAYWDRGYATQIAATAVAFARHVELDEVVGTTLTTNAASQRVLEKVGIGFEREIEHAGLPHWFGRLTLA